MHKRFLEIYLICYVQNTTIKNIALVPVHKKSPLRKGLFYFIIYTIY
jgi:hypothetical protein